MAEESEESLELLPADIDRIIPDRCAKPGEYKNLDIALELGGFQPGHFDFDIKSAVWIVHLLLQFHICLHHSWVLGDNITGMRL